MNSKFSWFGIDFGTTNSAAFSFTGIDSNNIHPIHYGDDEGRPFPSVVAINKQDGTVITGREAKDRRNELVETSEFFPSIKSIIDSDQKWQIAGKTWTAEDIAAEIFVSLKKRVEKNELNVLSDAVVAVPNGFSSIKKHHLRNAAKKAGIKITAFISEPTAAFCSNYNELKECSTVAVFDWGGGTLDVTVLNVKNGKVMELGSDGMEWAGNDIDRKLAEKMHAKFARKKGISISFDALDPLTKDQLLYRCEKAKCDFEDEDIVSINLNKYGEWGPVRESLDYDYFSLLIEEDVNNAIACLERAINKSGKNIAGIDRILCVGGSSKLRPLREKLENKFGEELLYYPDEVMWDIAKGAAISSSRANTFRSNQNIGIILSNGDFYPLLNQGQPLPCEERELSFAIVDDSKNAKFVITDNENPDKRTFTETIIARARGFLQEHFLVSCYVDQNFIFKLKIRSSYSYEEKFLVWEYDSLKVYWDIT